MVNPNVVYRATGRYMDGQKLIGYHLVGEDGSQTQESKERVIYLIGKGLISNMRIQVGVNNEVIIRGKGVNLNALPVYDSVKQEYRKDDVSQSVANSKVSIDKSTVDGISLMGQYTITRRVMYKNKCIGYELKDHSGALTRKKRDNVIDLAIQKLISNASAQKYLREGSELPEIILRGVGCEISKLPILIVTEDGKIRDPKAEPDKFTVRGAYMKNSGMIKDKIHNDSMMFKSGDFIVCKADGEIQVMDSDEASENYELDKEASYATCDDYTILLRFYSLELFGSKPIQMTDKIVKSWSVFKYVNNSIETEKTDKT